MKSLIILALILSCLFSCKSNSNMAILLNTEHNKWLETNGFEQWTPTVQDLEVIQDVLDLAIADGTFGFLDNPTKEGVEMYFRQYVPYIDKNGDHIVEINAFCEVFPIPESNKSPEDWKEMDWRSEYVIVDDGGNCFWKIEINVDKKNYRNQSVNGVG